MSAGLMLRVRCGFQPVAFTFGVLVAALVQGSAGEPIIVGKEKSKTDVVKESRFGRELSKPWEKAAPESPMSGLIFPSIIPRSDAWDPKGDRKRKLQEREKKNWMSVLPGELQEEEESKNFLGVRDYDIEREDDSDNLMFRDLQGERNSSQGNRQARNSQRENGPQRNETDDLERELAARRRMETRSDSQLGAHTAGELNFKNVFGKAPTEGRNSELRLRDVLGGSEQQSSKSQQALREEFRAFLHGQPNNQGTLSSGFSDPVQRSRNDFTRQPLNPAIATTPSTRADTFGAQPGYAPSRANSPFGASGFSDNSLARPAMPGFPTPSYTPGAPAAARPFQTAPPTRRGFDTLGGHNR